jgi:beta-carotene 3-hydroxylase
MIRLLVAASAFVAMEPAVAAVHRGVMHGRGWAWHRSHHRWQGRRIEANDAYPVVFAAATIATMAVGATIDGWEPLLSVGAGVTGYGIAYLIVHDLFIHERLGRPPGARSRYVRWVATAHAQHHRSGREPYGFLLPWVPARNVSSTPPPGRRVA